VHNLNLGLIRGQVVADDIFRPACFEIDDGLMNFKTRSVGSDAEIGFFFLRRRPKMTF
jgi:hypothetical protein